MENMLFAIHASQVGYQCCRGSRLNMPGPMKRPPAYFERCKEFNESPRSDDAQPSSSATPDASEAAPEARGLDPACAPDVLWTPPKFCHPVTRNCETRMALLRTSHQCNARALLMRRTPLGSSGTWLRCFLLELFILRHAPRAFSCQIPDLLQELSGRVPVASWT